MFKTVIKSIKVTVILNINGGQPALKSTNEANLSNNKRSGSTRTTK